jgi:hypothetical protein
MTLLTTAQEILKQTKEAVIPSTIIGNNNANQILEAMKLAVVSASRAYEWQELQKEHTFASVASTVGYALPSDYDSMINDTFWNSTNNQKVLGPKSPKEWRWLNNSTASNASSSDYFRIRDNETQIFPTPSSVENFVYEYMSNLIVEDSGGTGQTGWQADTDVPVIDEYLVKLNATWIFLKMQGRPYAEEQREYDLAAAERASVNGARETIYHTGSLSSLDKSKIGYPDLVPSA